MMPSSTLSNTSLARLLLLSCTAALGGFLFGFDSGVINGTIDALRAAFTSNSAGTGFNVAALLLGCAVGALFAGTMADKFGRKPVLLATAVVFLVGGWGSGIALNSEQFIFFRVLTGLAVGAASIICPAYISEIAPASIRGRLASLQQLMIVLGLLFSFISNYLLARLSGGPSMELWLGYQTWRWMLWVEIVPAVFFLAALLSVPESPRYLVAAGRLDEAVKVLKTVGHISDADQKLDEIRHSISSDHRPRLADLIDGKTGNLQPIVWVGIGIAALQQLVGINVVFYYGTVLWQAAGFTESNALLTNVITGCVNIFATFLAIALVDKVGRRPLLLGGSIGMALTLATLAIIFERSKIGSSGNLIFEGIQGPAALIVANLYVFFFAATWGPVTWIMLGEMFPNQFRGLALALSGFAQWIVNFLITMTFPMFLSTIGLGGSYCIYAFAAAASVVFVWKSVSETKGKRLEEMQSR